MWIPTLFKDLGTLIECVQTAYTDTILFNLFYKKNTLVKIMQHTSGIIFNEKWGGDTGDK